MSFPYWEYFLSIESDLARCGRFVEFAHENYETYSIEFARIIMASSSEFDTLAKSFCKLIDPAKNPTSINEYNPIIMSKYPKFIQHEILMPRYKLSLKPWENWSSTNPPDWWTNGYNKIKHNRDNYFANANLKNAILSTAGLLVGILYYYDIAFPQRPHFDLFQAPKIFEPQNYDPTNNASISWGYTLPK